MDDLSDEMLMALADGELDQSDAERVMAAVALSPVAQARYQAFLRTGRQLGEPFQAILDEAVSPALVGAIAAAVDARQNGRAPRTVSQPRETFAEWARRLLIPENGWGPAAVAYGLALAVGAGVGFAISSSGQPASGGVFAAGGMMAAPAMASALETTPSGRPIALAQSDGVQITPRLTFKTAAGDFCRQYAVVAHDGAAFEGVACRDGGAWYVRAQAPGVAAPSSDVTAPAAGAGSPLVEAIVDSMIAGDRLSEDEEARAINQMWSPSKR